MRQYGHAEARSHLRNRSTQREQQELACNGPGQLRLRRRAVRQHNDEPGCVSCVRLDIRRRSGWMCHFFASCAHLIVVLQRSWSGCLADAYLVAAERHTRPVPASASFGMAARQTLRLPLSPRVSDLPAAASCASPSAVVATQPSAPSFSFGTAPRRKTAVRDSAASFASDGGTPAPGRCSFSDTSSTAMARTDSSALSRTRRTPGGAWHSAWQQARHRGLLSSLHDSCTSFTGAGKAVSRASSVSETGLPCVPMQPSVKGALAWRRSATAASSRRQTVQSARGLAWRRPNFTAVEPRTRGGSFGTARRSLMVPCSVQPQRGHLAHAREQEGSCSADDAGIAAANVGTTQELAAVDARTSAVFPRTPAWSFAPASYGPQRADDGMPAAYTGDVEDLQGDALRLRCRLDTGAVRFAARATCAPNPVFCVQGGIHDARSVSAARCSAGCSWHARAWRLCQRAVFSLGRTQGRRAGRLAARQARTGRCRALHSTLWRPGPSCSAACLLWPWPRPARGGVVASSGASWNAVTWRRRCSPCCWIWRQLGGRSQQLRAQ